MSCKACNKSYLDSYEVATDSVRKANPTFSDFEVKVQVAQLFRPKFHQWKDAAKIEERGEEEYKNGEFKMNEQGDMYYPKTGETAEGMHENQRLLSQREGHSADEYSLEDHQRTRLVTKTLRDGATQVVTAYGDRDILEFNYNPETNRGFIRVINTAPDSNFHSSDEMKSIARSKFNGLQENSPAKNIFVLSDKPLIESVVKDTINTVQYVGKQTVQEVRQTFMSVRRYIEERKELGIQKKKLEQDISLAPQQQKHTIFETLKESVLPKRKSKQKKASMEIKVQPVKQKPFVEHVSIPMIAFASEKKLKRMTVVPEIQKFIARHERKVRKAKVNSEIKVAKQKTIIPKELFIKVKKEKKKTIVKKNKLGVFVAEKLPLKKQVKQKETIVMKFKKEKVMRERVFKEKVIRLFTLVKKLIRIKERVMIRSIKNIEKPRAEQKRKLQEKVLDFSIAFIFWMLVAKHKNVLTPACRRGRHEYKIIKKESSPWVLLAIIWHLAQLRESGMPVAATQPKQKKAKKTIYYPRFAPQGVIFAFQ